MKWIVIIFMVNVSNYAYSAKPDCNDKNARLTTPEIGQCQKIEESLINKQLELYTNKILDINQKNKKFISNFRESNNLWLNFIKKECNALYEFYIPGTGAAIFYLNCKLHYTKQRLNFLWWEYLSRHNLNGELQPPPKLRF